MSKMFKRKATSSRDSTGNSGWPDPSKMTALTVPGVVERGQCVQCADGKNNLNVASSAGAISGGNAAVAVPTVKAVPIVVSHCRSYRKSGRRAEVAPSVQHGNSDQCRNPQKRGQQYSWSIETTPGGNCGGERRKRV